MKTKLLLSALFALTTIPTPDPSARLPERLADTGLYAAGSVTAIDSRNLPFAPQYPLWSDGLSKHRWVYLPPGAAIDGADEHNWDFPVGTKFWKEFRRGDRKVETRVLWKVSDSRWEFGTYVWNEEGTDARIAPPDGVPGAVEVAAGKRHSIPAQNDCQACHGTKKTVPLGFTALQLSTDRDPNAIHGEPLSPGMITLRTLLDEGTLRPARTELVTNPPRIRAASPATRAVLGYLLSNCATCHNGNGEIAAMGPVVRVADLTRDGDEVARSLVDQATRWQVPGAAPGRSVLVRAGVPEESAIVARIKSRAPSSQMPPLGTVLRDQQAVDAITRWIAVDLMRSH